MSISTISVHYHLENVRTYCYLVVVLGGQLLKKIRTRLSLIQFDQTIARFEAETPLKKMNYKVFISFIFMAIGSGQNAWKSWKMTHYYVPPELCILQRQVQFISILNFSPVALIWYLYWVYLRTGNPFFHIFFYAKMEILAFFCKVIPFHKNWKYKLLDKK